MRSVVAVALALLCASASANPSVWAGILSNDCSAISTVGSAMQPAITADEQSVFTIRRLGSNVYKMCPGLPHKIQANFPEQRQYLITASQGSFTGANAADKCINRIVSPGPMTFAEAELNLPCDATGVVTLNMISTANPAAKGYKQVTTTLPVNPLSSCPASPCHAAAAAARANLESGGLNVQKTNEAITVQLPAIPTSISLSSTPSAANPSASAPAAAAAATPAAPATLNLDLNNLFKLPSLPNLNPLAGLTGSAGAADASRPNPAALLSAIQKLGAVAVQPTDAATAASAAPSVGGVHPLQTLSQINATQAWIVVRQLGQLLNTNDDSPTNLKSIMDFVHQAGRILPGASIQFDAAPDLPTSVLNVLKATGKLLPSDKPADLGTILNFCKSVGDLLGKLSAMRPQA